MTALARPAPVRAPARTLRGQVGRFALVGAVGTLAYLALYVVLRDVLPAHPANVASRLAVAVPTTWVNGRHTFGARVSRARLVGGAVAVLATGVVITAIPLAVEQAVVGPGDRAAELATLVVATAVATVARFVLLRSWLFRPPPHVRPTVQPTAQPTTQPTTQPTGP